ncbi:MAG: AraC family transcriptional regulator [Bermanella sp.]
MITNMISAKDAILPVFFPAVLFRLLKGAGIGDSELLTGTDLTPESFLDEDLKIDFITHSQFIKNAITASDDPHLAWRFGQHINVTSLGMVGYAAMSCHTIEDSLNTIIQYFKIRAPLYRLKLLKPKRDTEEAAIQFDESINFGEMRYFLLAAVASGTAQMINFYAGKTDVVVKIELACPPVIGWEQAVAKFPFTVEFNSDHTRLIFASTLLHQLNATADPQTEKSTKHICDQLLSKIESQTEMGYLVREYILLQSGKYPTLDEAAAHFCVSPRTFRRELNKLNTTYQAILDQVRETIALEYLKTTNKPVNEIAYELGFTDPSNFGRAFKKWTGKSPGIFRNN